MPIIPSERIAKLFRLCTALLLTLCSSQLFAGKLIQMDPSQNPPGNLKVSDVPQFIMLTFDDNPNVEDMKWILDYMESRKNPKGSGNAKTFDNIPIRAAFYTNGRFLDASEELTELHLRAYQSGHEIANHTQNHYNGSAFTVDQWLTEMQLCRESFIKAGLPVDALRGFRTPFVAYNAATFEAVEAFGLLYDTSVEEGFTEDQNGSNFFWPYTLHAGSPGNRHSYEIGNKELIGRHSGLWEVPIHGFMIPSDSQSEEFGLDAGLREKIKRNFANAGYDSWDINSGKVTGFDWNILEMAKLDGEEFLAILKYSLDLRLSGNRAPFMFGGHTALFSSDKPDRREALESFIDYALSHSEVRFVTPQNLIDWMSSPEPISTGK